jgi:hypothetical protein
MNGNATPGTRRKIQALTVSVNYADYLECIAPNRDHFDRWLVVTDPADTRTREVCHRFGMDVLFAKNLYKDGAAFHKAAALNEGLAALDQNAWVAVMDSDILLPRDFRQRLDAQPLDPSCLYGLAGRRVCATLGEFQALSSQDQRVDNLIHAAFVIGYFNLFYLGQEQNRYPENISDDASAYDMVFSEGFSAIHRRYLPFVCLHAGEVSQNWRGRTSDPFLSGPVRQSEIPDSTAEIAARLGGSGTHVVQIGCYRGEPGRILARHFDRVTVIDHWGLGTPATAPAMETDRQWLLARYEEEIGGPPRPAAPLEHSGETLAAIPDASVDALWLTFEPEYDFLLKLLPAWLPKLKPGGALVGGFYDPELLPGPSHLVQLLAGTPDLTFSDMQWVRIIRDPADWLRRTLPPAPDTAPRGVIYVAGGEEDVEPLLVSLSSLRRHWSGAVCVINAGDENPSLRLACARLGVAFRNVPEAEDPDLTFLQALPWSPFEETVCLACATLVRAPMDWLFEALDARDHVFCAGEKQPDGETAVFAWRRDSPLPENWLSLTTSLLPIVGSRSLLMALHHLAQSGQLHLRPPGDLWSGPAKRTPRAARIIALPRLARAGALDLYGPWAEEERALLQLLQAPA